MEENKNQMKPAENLCVIEGILSEVNLHYDTSKKSNREYVMGDIKVKVNTEIGGIATELEIPIRVFANKLTNEGKPNPAYDSITKIEKMTSLAACNGDVDAADRIRFENARVVMNEFYGRNGSLISYPTIRGTFAKKINAAQCVPTATFSNVIVVGGFKDQVDQNGDPTGALIIKGILPQWGGIVDVIEYVVKSESAIKHIQSYWQKGDTVRIAGIINFSTKVETQTIEMGFGEPEVKHVSRFVSELLVTKGSQGALDPECQYASEDITEALSRRQAYLNELKANADKQVEIRNKSGTIDYGF